MDLVYLGLLWVCSAGETEEEKERGEKGAEPSEPVAKAGVEGEVVFEAKEDLHRGAEVARDGLSDAALGIDDSGDAGVGGTEDPAMIFYGTHADHVEVFPRGAGVAVPAVVRYVD